MKRFASNRISPGAGDSSRQMNCVGQSDRRILKTHLHQTQDECSLCANVGICESRDVVSLMKICRLEFPTTWPRSFETYCSDAGSEC